MLNAMRQLSLWMLADQLGATGDVEQWYEEARKTQPDQLLTWLVEAPDDAEKFYTLTPNTSDASVAILEAHDLKESHRVRLPFNKPTGARSAAIGPVLKRMYSKTKTTPTRVTTKNTLKSFAGIAKAGKPWSDFFALALDCFSRTQLRNSLTGETIVVETNAIDEAIRLIPETKRTVLVTLQMPDGRLPGDTPEYCEYLMNVLAPIKYTTEDALSVLDRDCPMCGRRGEVLPNGIKGAGINFGNVDRIGCFPGLDIDDAWKRYAICCSCADLLYTFVFHFRDNFTAEIAGDKALVVPSLAAENSHDASRFVKRAKAWIASISKGEVKSREKSLLRLLSKSHEIAEISILWATFGQMIEDVRGTVSDVLPSRLRELDELSVRMNQCSCSAFPDHPVEHAKFDLELSFLGTLLYRPGGKKAKRENESKRLFDLKRSIVGAIYRGESINRKRFDEEVQKTAVWYLMDVIEDRNWGHLLYEGVNRKGEAYLTFAGWVRHLAMLFNYFRKTGVLPMSREIYQPTCERLKPYFTEETAIDSKAKAYAFMLGVLYGKLIQVQGAKNVNVGANALTWLRRLTLDGTDLPELYVKVRQKMFEYATEQSEEVREVVLELGELGTKTELEGLNNIDACYFLLLGQSLAQKILPAKGSETESADADTETVATA